MNRSGFYTSKGDHGDTLRLMGDARIPKSSTLIEAIGTMDEANAAIGMARALAQSDKAKRTLITIQRHLYRLMSHLSAVSEARSQFVGLLDADVTWLESVIAEMEADLPTLRDFVLPGESQSGAACHIARTAVRRAERRVITFTEEEGTINPSNLAYLNRLSSLLFVLALHEDRLNGQPIRLAREQSD